MTKEIKRELPIPNSARSDDEAFELARIWIANKGQHLSVLTGVWEDPAAWGIALVDLARHISNAYAEEMGEDRKVILERIKEGFDAEWDSPTDEAQGEIIHEK